MEIEITQDAAIKLVESIGETLGLERVNDASGVSYYAISEQTVVRISDHSTHLQTWVDYGTYRKENKYSIVIEVNPSKPVLTVTGVPDVFIVKEYKHKLKGLPDNAVLALMNAIKGAVGIGGQFSNPLQVKPKMLASTLLYESNTHKNMKKNTIKLNEQQLRNIVAESINKVLKEDYVGTDWFDENPNKGVYSEEFEVALNNAHKALNVLLNASVKESTQVQDINAKKDIERIKEGVNTCLVRLDRYVAGVRTC